ncbi:hypothetical protein BJV78DRAFT_1281278 [Lactifluus subvellereus]|nr:hypothetical protein BJV78DRAFT_1281278 [Lactifluus subvellereus]
MSFLSLSPELIEKIASYLDVQGIADLTLCCKRLHHIVEGSLLLRYLCQTSLAGVYDPLYDLSTLSITDRLETLERWEASWNNIGRYLTTPRLVVPAERDLFGPFFLCDGYLFAVDRQGHGAQAGHPTSLSVRQPALPYIDLRDALRTGQHTWKQINYPPGSIAITQVFSIEQDDLVASVLSLRQTDDSPTTTVLRFMSLKTGGVHPLAKEPHLPLHTQLPVSFLNVRADIIGDYIVLVLVDLRPNNPERDAIYLVDWKKGLMTLVHREPNRTYEGALAVLSPDLILFLTRRTKRKKLCVELCRVTRRGGGTDGTPDQSPPSLYIICTLALPVFHSDLYLHTAYMQTDRHCERRPRTMPAAAIQRRQRHQEQEQEEEQPTSLPFHSAPEDMVVGIIFILRERGPRDFWEKVVMTLSHRKLFALASTFRGHPIQNYYDGAGSDGDDEEWEEEDEDDVMMPWVEWGPLRARIIAPPSFQWITAYAGQRWLSLESDNKLVIRDFSAARIRRATMRARANHNTAGAFSRSSQQQGDGEGGSDESFEDGSEGFRDTGPDVWDELWEREDEDDEDEGQTAAKLRGGDYWPDRWTQGCFRADITSELPFLETRVAAPGRTGAMVLTDGKRLVVFVRVGQPPTFDIHVLDDSEE